MLEPTQLDNGRQPVLADQEVMWRELTVQPLAEGGAAVAYAEALRAVYTNGQVRHASFRVLPHPVFEWYGSRNLVHAMWFFKEFWTLPQVRDFMPEPLADLKFYSNDVFQDSSPFLLGGSTGRALYAGGAYKRHPDGPVHAKELGDRLANEWVDDRYDEVLVYESYAPWSSFFLDVAWDITWVAFDKGQRVVHVICGTDSD